MDVSAVATLSDMQRACLRLVAQLQKTEQIAATLKIAPSTVNTHIERAIARLGVPNRREAARLVVAYDAASPRDPAAALAAVAPTTSTASPTGRPEKSPTEELPLAAPPIAGSQLAASATIIGRRRNDLTVAQRLLVAILALALLCIAIAGLGAAIEQLSHWRSSLAQRR